ncbi:MAG: protease complex subunit PrcB family protein [Gemmatimonas sp.]
MRTPVLTLAFAATMTIIARPFKVEYESSTSSYAFGAQAVIADQQSLDTQWRTLTGGLAGIPAPTVDFAKTSLVLLALGDRNTGGYSVKTDSVSEQAGNVTVHFTVTSPGSDCMSAQMLTAPVQVISFDKPRGTIQFKRIDKTEKC